MEADESGTQAWSRVGEHFSALGEKLKAHSQQAAGGSSASKPDQAAVAEALNTLGRAIDQAVHAAGGAVKDPTVRDDLRNALNAMGDALNESFADAGDALGDRIKGVFGRRPPSR